MFENIITFNSKNIESFVMRDEIFEMFKNLKPIDIGSFYSKVGICFYFEDNKHIENDITEVLNFIQAYFRFNKFSEEFETENGMKDYHYRLLERTYFEKYEDAIAFEIKRPYGNSNVFYDVYEELQDGTEFNEKTDLYLDIHKEVLNIMKNALKCGELSFRELRYKDRKWIIDKKEERRKKLEKLQENEN